MDRNEKNPGIKEILAVAARTGLESEKSRRIAEKIEEIVRKELRNILKLSYF